MMRVFSYAGDMKNSGFLAPGSSTRDARDARDSAFASSRSDTGNEGDAVDTWNSSLSDFKG